jgi:apolipoprotein N-acyltransferase
MVLRISQLDWQRILLTRIAAILLGIAAALSVSAIVITNSGVNLDALSPLKRDALSIVGAASAFGFVSLLVCMGFFWLKCDLSPRLDRTIWFVILLLGFAYGSPIAYYAIVYLPAVLRRLRNPQGEETAAESVQVGETHKRIGPFRGTLLVSWGFFLLLVVAVLAFPQSMSHFVAPVAVCFFLSSALVVLEAVFHAITSVYRSGMSRSTRSGRADSSRSKDRDEEIHKK